MNLCSSNSNGSRVNCVQFYLLWFSMHACMRAKLLQLYLTLCNPIDCSPPGSSVYGIFQARIVEWVAMSSSKGSSWPKDPRLLMFTCIGRQVLYHRATWEAWFDNMSLLKYKCLLFTISLESIYFSPLIRCRSVCIIQTPLHSLLYVIVVL